MKKYFIKGIDEPLQLGDSFGIEIVIKVGDKNATKNIEVELTPEILDTLYNLGVIDEKEVNDPIDFTDNKEPEKEEGENNDEEGSLEEGFESLSECVILITGILHSLTERVDKLEEKLKVEPEESKCYTTINDYLKHLKKVSKPWSSIFNDPTIETWAFSF